MTTKEFVSTLKMVLPIVDKVPHSLGFHTVEMDGENLYAFNMIHGYKVPFPSGIKGAFNPYHVLKVAESWPDGELTITEKDGKFIFKSGRNRREAPLLDSNVIREFIAVENDEKEYFPIGEGFTDIIRTAIIPNNKKLPGVMIHEGFIISTNNVTIFVADAQTNADTFRLSEASVGLLSRHTVTAVKTTGVWAQFQMDRGLFMARLYDLTNIPLANIIPLVEKYEKTEPTISFETNDAFISALVAVSSLVEPEEKITLSFDSGGVSVTATTPEGSVDTWVETEVQVAEPMAIKIEASRITPVIKKGKATVKFVCETDKIYCLVLGKGYKFLVGTYR